MPYIRDTRRSIGLDGFILKVDDLGGEPIRNKTGKSVSATGSPWVPTALISTPSLTCQTTPDYVNFGHETLPFCIPFRALTHERYEQLPRRRQDHGAKLSEPTPPPDSTRSSGRPGPPPGSPPPP